MKKPATIPMKLQIKSSTSRLLPKIICKSSAINGTTAATAKIFFLLTFPVTKGRKNPNGKNMATLPINIVFIQLPITISPDKVFIIVGTKLKPPKLKIGGISFHHPRKIPS